MQNLPNYFTTPNKMTSENDIKGLASLKFLRPWIHSLVLIREWEGLKKRESCLKVDIALNVVLF
jgi:hypothetical protein